MSLQVWLPLTKDLRQQGLSNVTVTNNGTTYSSTGGKLGGCYIFDGVDDAITVGNLSTLVTDNFSFACWFYHDDTWSSKNYETIFGGPSGFELEAKSGSTNSPVIRAYSWGQGTFTYELNKWNHLVMTRTTSETKFYLNGELKLTGTAGTIPSGNYFVGSWSSTTGQNFKGKVNDVRIYDHCLSQMEVKELSKGLVLHYPLSDKYIESTTNLITTEDCLSATCFNGATNKYSYGTNTDMYKTVTTYDGRKGTKVYMGTNGNSCYPYVYINNMFTSDGTNAPAYKTLSFDYYTTISTSICPYKLGSGTGTATYKVINNNGIKTGTGTNSVTIPVVPNAWNHIEITFHGTTAANSEWGYIQNQPTHTSNTSNFWFFTNMQLEAKDHATGYVGPNGTRSTSTVYDCSGLCNNGTTTGNLSISDSTPRYKHSTYFNGSSYILTDSGTFSWFDFDKCTVSVWMKPTSTPSSWAGTFGIAHNNSAGNKSFVIGNYGGTFTTQSANGSWVNIQSSTLPVNEWHHCVATLDGTTIKMYFDGELVNTYTTSWGSTTVASDTRVQVGIDLPGSDEIYQGYYSDARIYTTALSAEDVLELYHTAAHIDNLGNTWVYQYNEI